MRQQRQCRRLDAATGTRRGRQTGRREVRRSIFSPVMGLPSRVRSHRGVLRLGRRVRGSVPACAGSPCSVPLVMSRDWVYPRVCGVTGFSGGWAPPVEGLSPRVRGHRLYNSVEYGRDGSIPACAGSPDHAGGVEARAQVYPRVCGVTSAAAKARAIARGLSPRVRGHRYWHYRRGRKDRSIPACAGSPSGARQPRPNAEVYPRVCGVTPNPTLSAIVIGGLSPRVRGHLSKAYEKAVSAGSIPACAGSPQRQRVRGGSGEVYPRVCGVTQPAAGVSVGLTGLSPRVRGHPLENPVIVPRFGSIPACAGSPLALRSAVLHIRVYPRVCGVTGVPLRHVPPALGLSPRVRGHLALLLAFQQRKRSIPACAGSPAPKSRRQTRSRVYPRVCGVTMFNSIEEYNEAGLSPRVRGHRAIFPVCRDGTGSIPACAGSPLVQFVRNWALRALRSVYCPKNATVCHGRRRLTSLPDKSGRFAALFCSPNAKMKASPPNCNPSGRGAPRTAA